MLILHLCDDEADVWHENLQYTIEQYKFLQDFAYKFLQDFQKYAELRSLSLSFVVRFHVTLYHRQRHSASFFIVLKPTAI